MKHNYTPEQMQAAIDESCNQDPIPRVIHTVKGGVFWEDQKAHRLHLIKTALDLLPEPPPPVVGGKTPAEFYYESLATHESDGYYAWDEISELDKAAEEKAMSAVIAAFGGASLEADKLRAEIAEAKAILQQVDLPDESLVIQARRMKDQYEWQAGIARGYEKQIQQANETLRDQLSALRPISEAGQVPAGCLRVYVLINMEGYVINPVMTAPTHFADIRLPESAMLANAKAHAEFQAELEAVWNAKIWTPKVGDVVTLKSGGPTMTVKTAADEAEPTVDVFYFDADGRLHTHYFPTATLQPA